MAITFTELPIHHTPARASRWARAFDRAVCAAVLVLLFAGPSAGCAPDREAAANGDQSLTDDAGLPLPSAPANRIVSLQPPTTELLFAIGAGDRVVGRSRWDAFPPAADTVPDVGDAIDPNVEAIAARHPDLVIVYPSNANQQAVERLHDLGIATVSLRMDSLGSVPRAGRILGRVAGVEQSANRLADAFAQWLDSARAAARPDSGPSVVIVTWDNPPIVIGGGSFLSELLRLAGARNIFADVTGPSAQVTIEAVADRDPDLLLFVGEGDLPDFFARPEWRVVGAVGERRVIRTTGSAFSWPSPRAPEAVDQLRALLAQHPW
jgi:ABC-type Fe3+-hydroxamate transport system substrate-binding protein